MALTLLLVLPLQLLAQSPAPRQSAGSLQFLVISDWGGKGGCGVKEKVAPAEWHTLRIEFAGNEFSVIFDGKRLFDVEDQTFTAAGKVGGWTEADSVTLFDDFSCGDK